MSPNGINSWSAGPYADLPILRNFALNEPASGNQKDKLAGGKNQKPVPRCLAVDTCRRNLGADSRRCGLNEMKAFLFCSPERPRFETSQKFQRNPAAHEVGREGNRDQCHHMYRYNCTFKVQGSWVPSRCYPGPRLCSNQSSWARSCS